ncbi:MAG TPA: ABC transporter permease subunit, partial [Anaerolineae bacterium]|nr:ABC transporter permease subunit [Anaerolineae bacterium]
MVAHSTLHPVEETGWMRGFANLFRKENREWWATRRWLLHAVLWTVMINGIIAFVVFVVPALLPQMEPEEAEAFDVVAQGVQGLFQLGTIGLGLGAIILAQDEILGERLSGVTEWILSKPVSRDAYVLSKLVANAVGVLILLVALQMAIAYALISVAAGALLPVGPYLIGFVGMALHTLFYLALTLMMGVLVQDRGP